MSKRLYGLRGATGALNTKEDITKNVCEMCNKVFTENNVKSEDIVSIQFTVTKDLDCMNPAAALRRGNPCIDVSKCALFCSQEPDIAGSPDHMVRLLLTVYLEEGSELKYAYVNGGEKLRPDFAKKIIF